eukprot:TRINITY_DN24110_c0_g1_i1.p1 TRINITY_DN24110_c0_g1~~TRINITY_DN24110_c0_g1_i1.p1  ORF type:complete len:376 (+),score=60.97 TRINITY_DN24110_c0_g1_i1:68-1195(+)
MDPARAAGEPALRSGGRSRSAAAAAALSRPLAADRMRRPLGNKLGWRRWARNRTLTVVLPTLIAAGVLVCCFGQRAVRLARATSFAVSEGAWRPSGLDKRGGAAALGASLSLASAGDAWASSPPLLLRGEPSAVSAGSAGTPAGTRGAAWLGLSERATRLLLGLMVGLASWKFLGGHAVASAAVAAGGGEAKMHLGQRVALGLRSSTGFPDWAICMLISAMPLIELRGGVPVGLWMGLAVPQVMLLAVLGNMLPMPFVLWGLKMPWIRKICAPLIERARRRTSAIKKDDEWVGLAAFVGVPLPGTGAWSGAVLAYLLGLDFVSAISALLAGVCTAAVIMASITLAGWYGCAIAVCLCGVALCGRYIGRVKEKDAS